MISGLEAISSAGSNISAVSGLSTKLQANSSSVEQAGNTPFSGLLQEAVGNVSRLEDQARVAIDGLMAGSGVDAHQAVIASEKASMAFELALAVRNKAIQSYQTVMGMQF